MADIRITGLLDDFERADESPLDGGGNWDVLDSAQWTQCDLVTGDATHAATFNSSMSAWVTQSFSGDCEAWGTCSGGGGGGAGIAWGIGLFSDIGGANTVDGYRFRAEESSGGDAWTLRKWTNGTSVLLVDAPKSTPMENTLMLIRRNGDDVECWYSTDGGANWTMALSATDTTYTTGLYLGLGVSDNSASQILGWKGFGGGLAEDELPQVYRRQRRHTSR